MYFISVLIERMQVQQKNNKSSSTLKSFVHGNSFCDLSVAAKEMLLFFVVRECKVQSCRRAKVVNSLQGSQKSLRQRQFYRFSLSPRELVFFCEIKLWSLWSLSLGKQAACNYTLGCMSSSNSLCYSSTLFSMY
jgi:hypothetical protein